MYTDLIRVSLTNTEPKLFRDTLDTYTSKNISEDWNTSMCHRSWLWTEHFSRDDFEKRRSNRFFFSSDIRIPPSCVFQFSSTSFRTIIEKIFKWIREIITKSFSHQSRLFVTLPWKHDNDSKFLIFPIRLRLQILMIMTHHPTSTPVELSIFKYLLTSIPILFSFTLLCVFLTFSF